MDFSNDGYSKQPESQSFKCWLFVSSVERLVAPTLMGPLERSSVTGMAIEFSIYLDSRAMDKVLEPSDPNNIPFFVIQFRLSCYLCDLMP
jgi:hypothetical protein